MQLKDADGIANSVDPDQAAPWSSLIWVGTVCTDQSVCMFKIFIVLLLTYGYF